MISFKDTVSRQTYRPFTLVREYPAAAGFIGPAAALSAAALIGHGKQACHGGLAGEKPQRCVVPWIRRELAYVQHSTQQVIRGAWTAQDLRVIPSKGGAIHPYFECDPGSLPCALPVSL